MLEFWFKDRVLDSDISRDSACDYLNTLQDALPFTVKIERIDLSDGRVFVRLPFEDTSAFFARIVEVVNPYDAIGAGIGWKETWITDKGSIVGEVRVI